MNFKTWFHGLVGAFIGGASASIGLVIVNPSTFNFQDGWKNLLSVFVASGLVSAAAYLKQSPLPKDEEPQEKPLDGLQKLGLILAGVLLLQGCATSPAPLPGEPVVEVDQTQAAWFKAIEPATAVVCSLTLSLAVNDSDRAEISNQIYTVARAVRTLAGGVTPTQSDVAGVLNLWLPDKAKYASLIDVVSGLYGTAYAQIKGNPKLAVQVLEQVALGCESAAGAGH